MKKKFGKITALILLGVVAGCGGDATSPLSQQAKQRAVKAAKEVVAIDATDTFAVQQALVEAAALRSQYLLKDDSIAARDFDNAFMEYLGRHNPQLAKSLKGGK